MIFPSLGWSAQDIAEYIRVYLSTHVMRVRLEVLDMNQNQVGDISKNLLTGSVSIDVDSDVQSSLDLTLFDGSRVIDLAPTNPQIGAAYPTRMIRVWYCISKSFSGSRWFEVPIFTGPVDDAKRTGPIVGLTCIGKESLSNGTLWRGATFNPGWLKTSLVADVLRRYAGETSVRIEYNPSKTTVPSVLNRDVSVYGFCRSLLNTIQQQAFYDGMGTFVSRTRPTTPTFEFNGSSILGEIEPGYDMENLINAVEISGPIPEGKTEGPTYIALPDPSHPLSPQSLGRNGVPRYLPYVEQNDDYKTDAQRRAVANEKLREGLLQAVDSSFPGSLPPGFEQDDLVSISTAQYSDQTRSQKFTIPLIVTETPSFGYNKKVQVSGLVKKLRS